MHAVYASMYTSLLFFGRTQLCMQLFYKSGRLRVVISTANLVPYDYRDIENVRRHPLLHLSHTDRYLSAVCVGSVASRHPKTTYPYPTRPHRN